MQLNATRLTWTLGVLLAVINLLSFFGEQSLYVAGIVTVLYVSIVPGMLLLFSLKVETKSAWEFICYSIGASLAVLLFSGIIYNTIGRLLGFEPLTKEYVLLFFDFIIILLGSIALYRNPDYTKEVTLPQFSTKNRMLLFIPMVFIVWGILGALLLNDGQANPIPVMTLVGIAAYGIFLALKKEDIREDIYPPAIFLIASTVLAMGWLRSSYVAGVDVNLEYHLFQATLSQGFWDANTLQHAYNLCLSITLLPAMLTQLTGIPAVAVFKLVLPLFFAFTPVIVYLLLRRYASNTTAYLASFFFMAQPAFVTWMQTPIRQEVATFAFALMLLVVFDPHMDRGKKNLLFLIFGFTTVVSHYTTAYVASFLFLATYVGTIIFTKTANRKPVSFILEKTGIKKKGEPITDRKTHVSGFAVFLLLLFTSAWYAQSVDATQNFGKLVYNVATSTNKVFNEELRAKQTGAVEQFNIFYKENNGPILTNYTARATVQYKEWFGDKTFNQTEYRTYRPTVAREEVVPPHISPSISKYIYLGIEVIKKLLKVFIIVGIVFLVYRIQRDRNFDIEFAILNLVGLGCVLAMTIVPFLTIEYDILRLYQQILVFLSLAAVFGGLVICKFFEDKKKIVIISVIFGIYFLAISGVVAQVVGNAPASMQLNNYGSQYNEFYATEEEVAAGQWLVARASSSDLIFAALRARSKLYLAETEPGRLHVATDVFPSTIGRTDFVYASRTNYIENIDYIYSRGVIIPYNYPTQFLENNKNKLYNNGLSVVYK